MPIPHFNTSEFFIDEHIDDDDDNEAILDVNDEDDYDIQDYPWRYDPPDDDDIEDEEYYHQLIQFSYDIERRYDVWICIVNHFRNDDVMDDMIEEVQAFQNRLSRFSDIVENNRSINADDKEVLLNTIALLNDRCEEALEGN